MMKEIKTEGIEKVMLAERELNNLVYGVEGFKRGMIAWVDLDSKTSVQRGMRPAVIIQNNIGNKYAPTLIVAPITSRKKRDLPTHVVMLKQQYPFLKKDSIVLLEQIVTVGKEQVGDYIGRLSIIEETKINKATKVSLALDDVDEEIRQRNKQIIDNKVTQIKMLDVCITKCLEKRMGLNNELVVDFLNDRAEQIKYLESMCQKTGLNVSEVYTEKMGAFSNELRGIFKM